MQGAQQGHRVEAQEEQRPVIVALCVTPQAFWLTTELTFYPLQSRQRCIMCHREGGPLKSHRGLTTVTVRHTHYNPASALWSCGFKQTCVRARRSTCPGNDTWTGPRSSSSAVSVYLFRYLAARKQALAFGDDCQREAGSQNRPASATTTVSLLCDLGQTAPHPGPRFCDRRNATVTVPSN